MEKDSVKIGNENIEFFYRRKKIKNLILRVDKECKIVASVPNRMPIEAVKEFIIKKYLWISKVQNEHEKYEDFKETTDFNNNELLYILGKDYKIVKVPSKENRVALGEDIIELSIKEKFINDKDYISNMYEKWLKEFELKLIEKNVKYYFEKMKTDKIPFPEIQIRKMRSRWGECFPNKNKVVFNLGLIKTPEECLEYVVVHELCHFKHKNHSKSFYQLVEKYFPDWKEARKTLNKKYTKIIT